MNKPPEEKTIPQPPFCINCSNFIDVDDPDNGRGDVPRCSKFPMLDVVLGEKYFVDCASVRGYGAPCDISGKMFSPKAAPAVEPDRAGLN
jgi:hypothetical protein